MQFTSCVQGHQASINNKKIWVTGEACFGYITIKNRQDVGGDFDERF